MDGSILYPIIQEDPVIHTNTDPFCFHDPSCYCHEDQEQISIVTQHVTDGLLTPEEATRFVRGDML